MLSGRSRSLKTNRNLKASLQSLRSLPARLASVRALLRPKLSARQLEPMLRKTTMMLQPDTADSLWRQAAGPVSAMPTEQRTTTAPASVNDALRRQRDLAWGALHWFDSAAYAGADALDGDIRVDSQPDARDLSGGWYRGDYCKHSPATAWSIALPLLTWQIRPQALPERIQPLNRYSLHRPAVLDLVKPQLDWLLRMQRGDGAVHHQVSSPGETAVDATPDADQRPRTLSAVSTLATAAFSATLQLAAYAFSRSTADEDRRLARQYQRAASLAWRFLDEHPEVLAPQAETEDDRGHRLWAAVARCWNRPAALSDRCYRQLWDLAGSAQLGDAAPGWAQVQALALFNYLAMPRQDRTLKDALLTRVENGFGTAFKASAGCEEDRNSVRAMRGTQLLWLNQLTGQPYCYQAAFNLSPWFFGDNPDGKLWLTGDGARAVQQPSFAPLASGALKAAPGLLVDGPGEENSQELPRHRDERQVKDKEVSLAGQAAWACYLSLLVAGPR